MSRCEQRLRPVLAHELTLGLIPWQRLVHKLVDEVLDARGVRRPGDHGVDGDAGTRERLWRIRVTRPSSAVLDTP